MSPGDHAGFRELICKLSDGSLTAEEAVQLGELLKADPIAQESYLDHLMIDGLLEREFDGVAARAASLPVADAGYGDREPANPVVRDGVLDGRVAFPGRVAPWISFLRPRALSWLPASLVLAFVGIVAVQFLSNQRPRGAQSWPLALADAGFECDEPSDAGKMALGRWYGDVSERVEEHLGVTPAEGRQMLRFVESSSEPGNACEIYQLVDLRPLVVRGAESEQMHVEASALFNSLREELAEGGFTFGITLFAFADDPSIASRMWPMRWRQPLLFSGRHVPADADPMSWQPVNARLRLPADARFLVVQLSVIRANPGADRVFPGQLVDQVALNLVCSR